MSRFLNIQTRIVGGEESEPGEFPYYVDMGGCGGSLIAPGVVLSAAHCGSYNQENVIVGGYEYGKVTGDAVRLRVIDEARHPNYNDNTIENDFLLLRLEETVQMNTDVVLSLNNQYTRPVDGQDLTVLGLGLTSDGGSSPDKLRDVVVQAISGEECNSSDSYAGEINDAVMFCAGVSEGGKGKKIVCLSPLVFLFCPFSSLVCFFVGFPGIFLVLPRFMPRR